MRRAAVVIETLFAVVFVAFVSPLLWAMRRDLRERNAVDAAPSCGYDDNDPGLDVDGAE